MNEQLLSCITHSLIELLFQIEHACDDQINADFAVSLMEIIGSNLQNLSSVDKSILTQMLLNVPSDKYDSRRKEYVVSFAGDFGLDGN